MTVAELDAKLDALKAALDALAAKVAAGSTGIDPATLDEVGTRIDGLTTEATTAAA